MRAIQLVFAQELRRPVPDRPKIEAFLCWHVTCQS